MTYYRKIILILLGLLMSMQAHSGAETGIVTATVVDTEAISGLSTIQVNSAKALGTNTFSNFESAVKDYQTIQNSMKTSTIDATLNNLAEASEVIAFYAVAYLVSVVDPLMEESKKSANKKAANADLNSKNTEVNGVLKGGGPTKINVKNDVTNTKIIVKNDVWGINKENRIFNEATTKVMDALNKIDNKSSLSSINRFVDTSIFKEGGTLLGPDGKPVSGCSSLFCGITAAIATRQSQAKGNVVDPYKFTIKLFEESKQLSKIMAPANKRKTEYFGGVISERYVSNRPGRREYGGDINFITPQVNQPRVVQQQTPQSMKHNHPVQSPTPPTPPTPPPPAPMEHNHYQPQ